MLRFITSLKSIGPTIVIFLTLFSLILILGVYYITLPSDVFSKKGVENVSKNIDVEVSESNKLVSLRVERDEKISSVMSELQEKIVSSTSTEEKNSAFEELQVLNLAKGNPSFLAILQLYVIK